MTKTFRTWLKTNEKDFNEIFEHIDVSDTNQAENSSVCAELISSKIATRIIVWDSGESEIQIINVETGSDLFYEYAESNSSETLLTNLDEFLIRLMKYV
jgi:actin-related protein